jgi:hypothetical protein
MARISKETAHAMAAKSAAARKLKAERRKQAKAAAALAPLAQERERPGYVAEQLACVRSQIDRVNAMILLATDPMDLDKLASSLNKLSERERVLDGRPLPGAHRPGPVKRPRPPTEQGPLGLA